MVERLPLPAAVIVRLGGAGVNGDRAMPDGLSFWRTEAGHRSHETQPSATAPGRLL